MTKTQYKVSTVSMCEKLDFEEIFFAESKLDALDQARAKHGQNWDLAKIIRI